MPRHIKVQGASDSNHSLWMKLSQLHHDNGMIWPTMAHIYNMFMSCDCLISGVPTCNGCFTSHPTKFVFRLVISCYQRLKHTSKVPRVSMGILGSFSILFLRHRCTVLSISGCRNELHESQLVTNLTALEPFRNYPLHARHWPQGWLRVASLDSSCFLRCQLCDITLLLASTICLGALGL